MTTTTHPRKVTRKQVLVFIGANLLLALAVSFFLTDKTDSAKNFILTMTWSLAVSTTQWLGHLYLFSLLDRHLSWEEHTVKRALVSIPVIVLYSGLAYYVVQVIMYLLVYKELPGEHLRWTMQSLYIPIGISLVISVISVSSGFLTKWKASLLENERIKAEMLMYKYEALQNQINPHFLFNSFNVLIDLVYEDQAKAVDFIRQLSQLFRYVLDSRDKELVSLSEELDLLDSYIYLLKTRFEDKLEVTVDIKAQQGEMLVPMTLQLLVENCVKHNEISSSQALFIRLSKENGRLRVENNLQAIKSSGNSRSTGLTNLRQQYIYFTEEELRVIETDSLFSVEVPILILDEA